MACGYLRRFFSWRARYLGGMLAGLTFLFLISDLLLTTFLSFYLFWGLTLIPFYRICAFLFYYACRVFLFLPSDDDRLP
jgi:hypothetical protein